MSIFSGIAAGISGGGLVPGVAGYFGAKADEQATAKANAWSAKEAQKNRDFQQMMSSTAHQRAVEDLRAAGLNPILAAGASASSPSGSMGQTSTADPAGHAQKAASSAADSFRMKKEMEATEQAIKNQRSQDDLTRSTELKVIEERRLTEALLRKANAELPAVSAEAEARRRQAVIDQKMDKFDATLKRVGKSAEAVGQVLGMPGKLLQGIKGSAQSIQRRGPSLFPRSPSNYRPGSAQNIFGELP